MKIEKKWQSEVSPEKKENSKNWQSGVSPEEENEI